MSEEPTWRSVEVEAGAVEAVENWLDRPEEAPLDNARFKRAVRAMLAENARLRSVLGHCPKGIAVLDESGRLTGHNRELAALLEAQPSLGESIGRYFADTDEALLRGVIARAGTTRRAAAVLRTTSGEGRDLEFFAATLPSESSRSIGVVLAGDDRTVSLHDESARRSIEEANRVGAWAIGNEATIGVVEAIRAEAETALERGDVDRVRATLAALRDVLVRRRSRPNASPESTEVGAVARRAARLSWVGGARQRPEIHVAIEEPLHVACSERDLAQVLANVLDNAVHAVDDAERFGVISVTAARVPGRDAIEIVIRDDGVGIDPARLQRCFEPHETTRDDGAAGVGLAIARSLVESVGGTIRAISEAGRGTVVVIELPRARG